MIFGDTLQPIYAGVVAYLLFLKFGGLIVWPKPERMDALYGSGLTFGGVILGFIVSAKAILIASNSKLMTDLKSGGALEGLIVPLVDRFAVGIYVTLLFSILNALGFFAVKDWLFRPLWISSGVAMLYAFHHIARILFRIARS